MNIRLGYLKDILKIHDDKINNLIALNNTVYNKSEILRNMVIKYNITNNAGLLEKIKKCVKKLKMKINI